MLGHFEEGNSKGPDVGGNGIGLTCYSFGCHVVGCADEGVCVAFGTEFATDTEVAQFDLAISAEEYIRRFDV